METEPDIIETKARSSLKFSFWVRLLVGVILLVLIVNLVNARDFVAAFRNANIFYMLLAASLVAANLGLQILKWNYFMRFLPGVSRKNVIASFFFGMTLGSFTPGQLGEFGGRAIHLPATNRGTVVGLAVIDKLQTFGIMALGGICSLLLLYRVQSIPVVIAGIALSFIIVFHMFRFSTVRLFLLRVGMSRLKHPWVMQAVNSLSLFEKRDIFITTFMTIGFYCVVYLQLHFLMNAFQDITPLDSFLAYAGMMFSKALLPFAIADLGIREFGLVYFASQVGYAAPAALASSLLLFVINIAAPALVGLFFIPRSLSPVEQQ